MPNDVSKKYQEKHLARIKKSQDKIRQLYESAIRRIYRKATGLNFNEERFSINDFPSLKNEIDQELLSFSEDIEVELINGLKDQWQESINKNAEIVHKKYGKDNVSDMVNKMLYDPQADALEAFEKRKINGLGLSDRVWKYTNQFQAEIEMNLYAGLSEGKSAAEMARDHKQYLENPDMLFRRVRNAKGNLVLSKNAKKYNPGRGVYRSSYKNAMRLTRDTINDSYRESDMIKYQTIPFMLGYRVNLSNSHPVRDICDDLQGLYPTTFKWLKWHNQCLCNCIPELPSSSEYAKYEQAILNGTEEDFKFKGMIVQLPGNFKEYLVNNKGRMDNWNRKPDWVVDNGIRI